MNERAEATHPLRIEPAQLEAGAAGDVPSASSDSEHLVTQVVPVSLGEVTEDDLPDVLASGDNGFDDGISIHVEQISEQRFH